MFEVEFYKLWYANNELEPFEKMVNDGKKFDDVMETETAVIISENKNAFLVSKFKTDI